MSQRIALVVANLHYRDAVLGQFPMAGTNVDLLASLLNDPEIGNFDSVTTLVGETADVIQTHIRDFFRLRRPYDLLFLYTIGDWLFDEAGELYFPTVDSRCAELAETAVPAAYITGWMDRSFSRRQVLVVDGRFGCMAGLGGTEPESAAIGPTFQGNGQWRTVVSSRNQIDYSLATEVSANELTPTYFTNTFIEGLQTGEADLNGDTLISLSELFEYVTCRLAQQTDALSPHIWRYGERDELAILGRRVGHVRRRVKWDLLAGGICAPLLIVLIGGRADPRHAGVMALLFVAFYTLLYIFLED